MNAAIIENMDHDDSKNGDESIGKDPKQLSPEKTSDHNDVVSDVGTSLGQREKQHNDVGPPDKDVSVHENELEKELVSPKLSYL